MQPCVGAGEVLSSFGGDHGFIIPHGVFVDNEDNIWVTDCGLHQVFKFDRNGALLFTLGTEGGPDPDMEGGPDRRLPFTETMPAKSSHAPGPARKGKEDPYMVVGPSHCSI